MNAALKQLERERPILLHYSTARGPGRWPPHAQSSLQALAKVKAFAGAGTRVPARPISMEMRKDLLRAELQGVSHTSSIVALSHPSRARRKADQRMPISDAGNTRPPTTVPQTGMSRIAAGLTS